MGIEDTTGAASPQAVEPNDGASEQQSKSYTQEQVEQLLKDRLAKAERKFVKKQMEAEAQLSALKNPKSESEKPEKSPVESEYKQRLAKFEAETRKLQAKLDKHRQTTLKATVQQSLAENDCLDPDIAFNDLLSKGLVKLDDDDEIVVPEFFESLDAVVKDYLGKKDYLVKAKRVGGVGSKAPVNSAPISGNQKDQALAAIQMVKQRKHSLFGDKPNA